MAKAGSENHTTSGNDEPKTHVAPTMDRPVRVRKSKERLIAVMELDRTAKTLHIEQGRGTPLKDIPNVVYKLSKKRAADDALELLHTILFKRRGKASKLKSNIMSFSGFAWNENEEKEKTKMHTKLNKFYKEKLFELCDLLDVPITKNTTKKDVIAKLIDFLLAPHATTSVLLGEKEQSSKGNKRKRVNIISASISEATPSKKSKSASKAIAKTEEEEVEEEVEATEEEKHEMEAEEGEEEDEAEDEEEEECEISEEKSKSACEPIVETEEEDEVEEEEEEEDEAAEEEEEDETEDGEEEVYESKEISKSASKATPETEEEEKEEADEEEEKEEAEADANEEEEREEEEEEEEDDDEEAEAVEEEEDETDSEEEESEEEEEFEHESTIESSKVAVKEKTTEERLNPSDDKLRSAISEIIKEIDVYKTSFNDILKQLNERFDTDLTSRKDTCSSIIEEEMTRIFDTKDDST